MDPDLETDIAALTGIKGAAMKYGHPMDPRLEQQIVYARIHNTVRRLMRTSAGPLTDAQQIEILRLLRSAA
jgi:hypothetical protein